MEILQSLTAPYENLNWFLPPDMVNSKRDRAPRTLINIISNLEFIASSQFSNLNATLKNIQIKSFRQIFTMWYYIRYLRTTYQQMEHFYKSFSNTNYGQGFHASIEYLNNHRPGLANFSKFGPRQQGPRQQDLLSRDPWTASSALFRSGPSFCNFYGPGPVRSQVLKFSWSQSGPGPGYESLFDPGLIGDLNVLSV